MEVYKSGHTLGDPVHEPGPSSNPLPKESPRQTPPVQTPPSAPNVHKSRATREPAGRHKALSAAGAARRRPARLGAASASPQVLPGDAPTTARYFASAGCTLAAAAVVIAGRRKHAAGDAWAGRVDQALADNSVKSFRRTAWLARARRRKQASGRLSLRESIATFAGRKATD